MIPDYVKRNFETIQEAVSNGDVAILECTDRNGKPVYALCAVNGGEEDVTLVPLASLFTADPYSELIPPGGTACN